MVFIGFCRTPIKSRSKSKQVAKYRHDENVLESQPTVYRQIVINNSIKSEVTEYYTGTVIVISSRSDTRETGKVMVHHLH